MTKIRIRMDPHWFGFTCPVWIRIETNADQQHYF